MTHALFRSLHRRFNPASSPVSRREALRGAMAASAGLLLGGVAGCAARRAGRDSARRVLVVGGGFAGLACAHELLSAGHRVRILEARSRVGGRVLTFRDFLPGATAEGGGELIGSNHATWMAFAKRFNLSFLDVTEDENLSYPVTLRGRRLSDEEVESLYHDMDAIFARMTEDARPVSGDRPWESPDAAALDARSTADWLATIEGSELVKHAVAATMAADNAVPLEQQSLLANLAAVKAGGLEAYWTDSEVYRCEGGNDRLASELARAIGQDAISLRSPVVRIDCTGPTSSVLTGDGKVHEGDEVVLAVPPSVWPKIDIRPALPEELRGGSVQMGTAVKWLARVKARFWVDQGVGPGSMSDAEISETWEGTDGQGPPAGAVMVAFSGGAAAQRCRAFPGVSRDKEYVSRLGPIYEGMADQVDGTRFMDWPGDPWTLAGYSFPRPGAIMRTGPILHAGVGRLRFAGEHTSFGFPGFMEGALESGVRVARSIHAG